MSLGSARWDSVLKLEGIVEIFVALWTTQRDGLKKICMFACLQCYIKIFQCDEVCWNKATNSKIFFLLNKCKWKALYESELLPHIYMGNHHPKQIFSLKTSPECCYSRCWREVKLKDCTEKKSLENGGIHYRCVILKPLGNEPQPISSLDWKKLLAPDSAEGLCLYKMQKMRTNKIIHPNNSAHALLLPCNN